MNIGDKVRYTFPMSDKKSVDAIIEFLGETVIHLKSSEGYKIKVNWINFDNIQRTEIAETVTGY